ncbi:WecB/TagA/CpsF family glycosyltransferase [Candidatus Roizmanbacteria bacterium]|nr:WecB/TagA/CpsF family glycosyltransferase [Candidatus Roizmanbacteria bacterium]
MKKILKIELKDASKKYTLEKIEKFTFDPKGFFHIVSLNPENFVIAQRNSNFRKALQDAQIQLIDGFGVVLAGMLLGLKVGERMTGTDLMEKLMDLAIRKRLTVVLIGGGPKLAEYIANCYNQKAGESLFFGLEGIKNIKNPKKEEVEEIMAIIRDRRPYFLFVSFGSPAQELWIWKNRHKLKGIACMGVGGAFDFLAGRVRRAPKFVRSLGLEWTWRLIRQPWRLKRQLRIPYFLWLVLKQKFQIR